MTGEPGRPGVRVGSSLIDQGTGTWAALGILAALLERGTTGVGRLVDVSLYETALGYIGYHLAGYLADGTVPRGQGTGFPGIAPYEVIRTRDGELMVAAGNDRLYMLLCGELGADELAIDPRFRTNPDRVANREALIALLEPYFAQDDTASWHERLTRAGVPAAPVADVADVLASPQTEALGIVQDLPHPRSRTSDCRRCRCRSTASASCTGARRRSSASTPPRSCGRPATTTRRSPSWRQPASSASGQVTDCYLAGDRLSRRAL